MINKFINGSAVIDNTVLSNFAKTGTFYLIKETLKGVPIIMLAVKEEASVRPDIEPDVTKAITDGWLKVETLQGRQALIDYYRLSKKHANVVAPKAKLGDGEAASLVYAAHNDCVLITDDNGPRKRAEEYGVKVAGTLSILYFAHIHYGLLNYYECNGIFLEMKNNGGFFPKKFTTFEDIIPEMNQKFNVKQNY